MNPHYSQNPSAPDLPRRRRWNDPVNPQQPFSRAHTGPPAEPVSRSQPSPIRQRTVITPTETREKIIREAKQKAWSSYSTPALGRGPESVPDKTPHVSNTMGYPSVEDTIVRLPYPTQPVGNGSRNRQAPRHNPDPDFYIDRPPGHDPDPDFYIDRPPGHDPDPGFSKDPSSIGRNIPPRYSGGYDWPDTRPEPGYPTERTYPGGRYPGARPPSAWDRPVHPPAGKPRMGFPDRVENPLYDSLNEIKRNAWSGVDQPGIVPAYSRGKRVVRARPGSHAERSRQRRDALRAENAERRQEMQDVVDAFNKKRAADHAYHEARHQYPPRQKKGTRMPVRLVLPDGTVEYTDTNDPRFDQPKPKLSHNYRDSGPTDEERDAYWRNRGINDNFTADDYYFKGGIEPQPAIGSDKSLDELIILEQYKGANREPLSAPQNLQATPSSETQPSDLSQYPLMQNAHELAAQERGGQTLEDIQFPEFSEHNNQRQSVENFHRDPLAVDNTLPQTAYELERDKPLDERLQQEHIPAPEAELTMGKDAALQEAEAEEKHKPVLDGSPPPTEAPAPDQATSANKLTDHAPLKTAVIRDEHSGHLTLQDDTQIGRAVEEAGDTPVYRRNKELEKIEKDGVYTPPANPMAGRGGLAPAPASIDLPAIARARIAKEREEAKARTDAAVDKVTQIVMTQAQWQADIKEKIRTGALTNEEAKAEFDKINSEVTTALQQADDDYQKSLISAQDLDRIYKTIGHTGRLQEIQKAAEREQVDNKAINALFDHLREKDIRTSAKYREDELRYRRYPEKLFS